jgi:hypothetical protein
MARVPRRLARIGAADLANSAAFDAYVGPSGELTVDHIRHIIALHDGVTPGGNQFTLSGGGSVSPATLRDYKSGLTLSNSISTPNTQIDVAAGVTNSDANDLLISLAAGTINCAGTGINGLDAGVLAASTWYHAFAIAKADGTAARLASLSPTAPTLPTGYTKKRRLGSFKTNGSSQIIAFRHVGPNEFMWTAPAGSYSLSNPGTAAVLVPLEVPSGIQVRAIFNFYLQSAEAARRVAVITSPLDPDVVPNAGDQSSISTGTSTTAGSAQGEYRRDTNTSRQIRYRLDGSSANTSVWINTIGWTDYL